MKFWKVGGSELLIDDSDNRLSDGESKECKQGLGEGGRQGAGTIHANPRHSDATPCE